MKKLKKFRSKKGFTLVELLVAMVITSVMSLGAFTMMLMATRSFDNATDSNKNQQSSVILEIRLHNAVATANYVGVVKSNTEVKKGDLVLLYEKDATDSECRLKMYEITADSKFMDSGNKELQQIFSDVSAVSFELRLSTSSAYKLDYKINTNENGMNVLQGGLIVNGMKGGDTFGKLEMKPGTSISGTPTFTTADGITDVFGIVIRP